MALSEAVHVVEQCRIAPPPATITTVDDEKSLPLTFFDLPWLHAHLIQTLFFYEFPHSKAHFLETALPDLKHSLSLALRHYYFLAGNLTFPPNSGKPEIRYRDGDSVSLIFAESTGDFDYFIGNHPRNVSEFHPLVPPLSSSGELIAPLLAIQVTLFPGSGISLGFTFAHSVADGAAFTQFVRLWALINKLGEEAAVLEDRLLPFYDRTVVNDPLGIESIYWDHVGKTKFQGYRPRPPTDNVIATFVLGQDDLRRLKTRAAAESPSSLSHLSTFTVACAYVWACMAKAREKSGEEVTEDEPEHLAFVGDCRAHFDPPIPDNYFGNCLAPCSATVKSGELIGEDGFVVAAGAIGRAIRERLRKKEGIMRGLEKWMTNYKSLNLKRIFGVAGSPKFSCYDVDLGFGRPCKGEIISIDVTKSISINEGKNNKQDVEVSLSFPKMKMDAFTSVFVDGLKLD